MTYAEATALALAGKTVMRPHWHWIGLASRPARGVLLKRNPSARVLMIVDEDGNAGNVFKPIKGDETATDWMERP